MPTVAEIQRAILSFTDIEHLELRRWFDELDWEKWDREKWDREKWDREKWDREKWDREKWDREIEKDSADGRLDFLAAEALGAKERGELKCLTLK